MKKITSQKKKLPKKKLIKENLLVCNKKKTSKFQTCNLAKKNARENLKNINIT
jgi:hypothetical protein